MLDREGRKSNNCVLINWLSLWKTRTQSLRGNSEKYIECTSEFIFLSTLYTLTYVSYLFANGPGGFKDLDVQVAAT